jgi:hypothetical protein
MAEQVALEAYESLLAWLRKNNLEWVAEQVENEITLGKIKSERIAVEKTETVVFDRFKTLIESDRAPQKLTGRSSAEFLARVEYNPFEKFEIAIGAVEAVVLGAVKIQDSLLEVIGPSSSNINFVPGETGDFAHSVKMDDLAKQRDHVAVLTDYFRMLREDVYNAD